MRVVLPFPPSHNALTRSRAIPIKGSKGKFRAMTYLSKVGRDYMQRCNNILQKTARGGTEVLKGPVSVRAVFWFPDMRGDLTNRRKVILDVLEGVAYTNDRQVWHYEEERRTDRLRPRVELEIQKHRLTAA